MCNFSEGSLFLLKKPWKKKLSFCEKAWKQKDLEKKKTCKKTLKKYGEQKNLKKKFGKRKRLKTNLAKENLSKKKKPLNKKLNSFEKKKTFFLKKQNKTSISLEIKNNRFGEKPTS